MSELTIITNNQYREILYSHDVPEKVLKNDFDWMGVPEEFSFFKYRGQYYTLSNFMRIENNDKLKDWDGIESDSFFSGTLVKFSECGDSVKVGRYYS